MSESTEFKPLKHGTVDQLTDSVWCAECGSWISKEVLDDFQHVHFRPQQPEKKYSLGVLNEREKTHGSFERVAVTAQDLKYTLRLAMPNDTKHEADQIEAMQMICTKLARIANGNCNEVDHWKDIAGYATLIAERLEKENEKKSN